MLSLRETVFRRLRLQKKTRRQKQALRHNGQPVSVESLEVRSLLTVTVLGTSDPWLAGMPNGSTASSGSVAPAYSPVLADVAVTGGQAYTFAATGSAGHGGHPTQSSGPDGRLDPLFILTHGAQNGIGGVTARVNALFGVFLNDSQPNTTGAPPALNFSTAASMDFTSLSPQLKQPFFIGDGFTSSGVTQQFVAPAGATRLFLGVYDQFGYSNNVGSYSVTSAQVNPNTPPAVLANAAAVSANEGGTVSNTGTFFDSQGNATVTITASVGTVTQNNTNGTWSWSLNVADGPASGNVTITARDNQNSAATATFAYSVNNIAPTISLSGNATVNEGSPYTLNLGVVTDPGQDTIQSYIINWGDGTSSGVLTGNPANTTATHIFADGPATQTNNVTVTDEDGNFLAGSLSVQILNVAPSVANTGDVSVNEGSTVTNSGTWSDPGLDIVTLAASVGMVTKNADGTWSWSFNTNDGPDESQTVTITATDSDGAATSTTFDLTVNNVAPSVANAGDVSVNEGSTATNSGTWSDPGLDIVTLSASVGTVTKNTDGTWSWSFNSNDGPDQSQTVTVTATDSDGASTTTSFNLTVNNVTPDAVNDNYSTSQATLLAGNVITGGGADTDPTGANDPLTVVAVNGVASNVGQAIALSNGTLTLNADGSFSYQPDTTFVGTESFTYTVSDGDGGFDTATVTIVVNAAAGGSILTVVDTCCDGGTALLITGTSANDHIVVAPGSTSTTLHVNVNGAISTVARPSGRIIVLGLAGNDNIQIAGAISNSVWLYGDEGDDRLNAGNVSPGGNLLFGGDGNDDLLGGNGRDILIGGQGADKITANADDDILIAGLTTHDVRNSVAHEEFWCNVLHEWTELDPFATRVNRLRIGSGHTGANLLASVLDDNSVNQIDQLQGSSGNDWFLLKSGEDKITGQTEATN